MEKARVNDMENRKDMPPLIAPSILSADFAKLGEEVRAVETAGADWIHVDVMDGHFVPNITLGPLVVKAVHQVTPLPLDVHLMITHPERYIDDFVKAGAALISITQIHEAGAQAGVVLNPATPLAAVEWVLDNVDLVLIMSVNPGFGGQKFIPNSLSKIRALRRIIDDRELSVLIELDGGVNTDTIGDIAQAGIDVFVAGSAIFGSDDYKRTIGDFRRKIAAQTT